MTKSKYFLSFISLSVFAISSLAGAAVGCNDAQIENFYTRATEIADKRGSYEHLGIEGTCPIRGRLKKLTKGYEFRFKVGILNEERVIHFSNKRSFVELFRAHQGPAASAALANPQRPQPIPRVDPSGDSHLYALEAETVAEKEHRQNLKRIELERIKSNAPIQAEDSAPTSNPKKSKRPANQPDPDPEGTAITMQQLMSTPWGWGGSSSRGQSTGRPAGAR